MVFITFMPNHHHFQNLLIQRFAHQWSIGRNIDYQSSIKDLNGLSFNPMAYR